MVHVCRPGDTIARIAEAYGLSVDQIAVANRLALPCTLVDGQRLVIPLEPPARAQG